MQRSAVIKAIAVVLRVVIAVAGGYATAAGLAALAAVGLPPATGLPRGEAVVLSSMLAFPVYLVLLVWAFAEPRLARLCALLPAGALASWGGAWGLMRLANAG